MQVDPELEPREPDYFGGHESIDGCGAHIHDECTGCAYESQLVEAVPCCLCWNGGSNGDGDWCYFEKKK